MAHLKPDTRPSSWHSPSLPSVGLLIPRIMFPEPIPPSHRGVVYLCIQFHSCFYSQCWNCATRLQHWCPEVQYHLVSSSLVGDSFDLFSKLLQHFFLDICMAGSSFSLSKSLLMSSGPFLISQSKKLLHVTHMSTHFIFISVYWYLTFSWLTPF